MRANRRTDTAPEVQLRSALHVRGFRFRKDYAIPTASRSVRADIAFPSKRLAVFVDGCFWHRCPQHGLMPKRNRAYWEPKLQRNVERDRSVTAALADVGWKVLRFWEHEAAEAVVEDIARALKGPGHARGTGGRSDL